MALTDEVLAEARDYRPAALEALLAAGYAPARRISHALSGSEAVGRAVAELLIRRSLRMLPKWRDPSSPENWFYHHALLTTRSANVPPPEDPLADPLVLHGPADQPAFAAFIRALRLLPPQQREAFILHHGERLNARMLGVAMDCSMQAAETHLQAASDALRAVSGDEIDSRAAQLTRAYAALQASEPDVTPSVHVYVRQVRRRMLTQRIIRVLIVALVLGALAAGVWLFREKLLQWMR
jgi:DNA-directed RNA polymerase specialized sigma24 family protein